MAALQAPRVSRSRRDDRYQAGRPAPGKRAAAGIVASVQTDTVTVLMADVELTGVIPLRDLPPVGALVEVEARGDLLVIPTWFDGPPPLAGEIVVDIFLTQGLITPGSVLHDLPADGPITFNPAVTTHLIFTEWDGLPASGTDYIPATPDGYTLTDIRPFLKAHTTGGSPVTITEDTSGWGYIPPPTLSPYLLTADAGAGGGLCFDTFPAGSDPAEVIVCGAGITPPTDQYEAFLHVEKWTESSAPNIVLSQFGWRHTFTVDGA